jgi:hypothetical protein
MRRVLVVLVVAALGAVAPACGSSSSDDAVDEVRQLPADLLPSSVLGLSVRREDVKEALERGRRPYVDALGLYSFRRNELLQATLQVSRFTDGADVDKASFRLQLIDGLGTSAVRQMRLGDDTVYLTTGQRQNVAVWFRGPYLFVLTVRQDFTQPRSLLRQALRFQP